MEKKKDNTKNTKKQETNYQRSKLQRDIIIERLRNSGFRITTQRLILLDIILEDDFANCKEIEYRLEKLGYNIGTATIYRMLNTLESIGAINRRNIYKIHCEGDGSLDEVCTIEYNDSTIRYISANNLKSVIIAGLEACGYTNNDNIKSVSVKECECIAR